MFCICHRSSPFLGCAANKAGAGKSNAGNKKSRAEDDAGFKNPADSLAVFNVEQVALNRHKVKFQKIEVRLSHTFLSFVNRGRSDVHPSASLIYLCGFAPSREGYLDLCSRKAAKKQRKPKLKWPRPR
jgi:hypothetical protein